MMDRWWAPQRPTMEPDAVVLAMLEPGDLGSALLAAHRAGAAAMETVSKSALPSEERLTGAMVTARANVSDRVVDSVSKAVTTPTYAALLVRDVLDDAEEGALSVYRTAIAKGISPPVAATRAAAIYGVPARELGRYLPLATDPRSNPVTVTDAADRALMEYVSKLVTQEGADGQVVEFAKSPSAEHHHVEPTVSAGWDERLHPRGPEGQFTRKPEARNKPTTYAEPGEPQTQPRPTPPTQIEEAPAVGSLAWLRAKLGMAPLPGAPAKVADVPVEEKAPPRVARQPKQAKTMRTAKTTQPRAGTARRTGTLRRTGTAQRKGTAQRVRDQLRRLGELTRLTDTVNRASGATREEDYAPADTDSPTVPDFLRSRNRMEHDYDLDPSFSFVVDRRAANDFITKLADQAGGLSAPSERVFRVGYLLDLAGSPDVADSKDAREALRLKAEAVVSSDDYKNAAHPDQTIIHPQDMRRNAEHVEDYIKQRVAEKATKQLPGESFIRGNVDPMLLSQTVALPLWEPVGAEEYDEENRPLDKPEIAIVQFDPRAPRPIVDEFVIDHGARGTEEGSGAHMEYELNPHQAYRLKPPPGSRRGERLKPHQLWDATHGVIVNRWYLEAIDENDVEDLLGDTGIVGKAERYADRPRPVRQANTAFEQLHPRDEDGKFTETAERTSLISPSSSRVAEPTKPLVQRKMKTMRTAKTTRTARQGAAQREGGLTRRGTAVRRGEATRRPMLDALGKASVTRLRRNLELAPEGQELPDLPVLDDRKRYIVLTAADRAQFLADIHTDGTRYADVTSNVWHNRLARADLRDGSAVMSKLNYQTQLDVDALEGPALGNYGWNRRPVGKGLLRPGSDDDELNLGNHIAKLFHDRPEIAQIHIDYGPDTYTLYANSKPVPPQAIIEVDEEIDWTQPVTLIPLGSYRANEMLLRRSDVPGNPLTSAIAHQEGDAAPANASAMSFLVQNSRVDRYRVQNE